jgi:hypothetical protein
MSGRRTFHFGAAALALFLAAGGNAFAQTSARPYRSLFGGSSSGTDPDGDWLMLTATEAYDQNVLGDVNAPVQQVLQKGGDFTEVNAEMNYRAASRRVQFASTAGTTFRYYRSEAQFLGVGHHVGAGATINLSPSTILSLNQTAAYSPSYLYGLFTNIAAPELGHTNVGTNYAVTDSASYNYDTRVTLIEQVGARNSVALHVGGRYTDFVHSGQATDTTGQSSPGATVFRDLLSYEAGGTFSRGLTRDLHLDFGYTFRRTEYFDGSFPTEHDVNAGIQYSRPLSRTRRTTLRVSTGSVMLHAPAPGDAPGVLRPQYGMTAEAALTSQFGRTWQAEGGYRRGVSYIEGIQTPVLTDGLTTSVSGLLTPRINLLITGAYSVGQPTIANASHGLTTYTADARTSFALNRTWAFFAEYLYYFYDFSAGIVPVGAPPHVARNSARAGLMLWVPMRHR